MPNYHSLAAVEIGRRIRDARLMLGISMEDLGELSEIGWTSIGRIERGVSSPTAETLIRIAAALDTDPGNFISGIRPEDYGARRHKLTARDVINARRIQG